MGLQGNITEGFDYSNVDVDLGDDDDDDGATGGLQWTRLQRMVRGDASE